MHRRSEENAGSADAAVSHSVSQTPEEVLAYWTPERMAEAVPRDIRLPVPEERQPETDES